MAARGYYLAFELVKQSVRRVLAKKDAGVFEMLEAGKSPAVRAALGRFAFVYFHPYTDGNGRMGRLMATLMLAPGGYPWTVMRAVVAPGRFDPRA